MKFIQGEHPMGKVIYSKHGGQTGPLCCRHLLDAAMSAGAESPPSIVQFKIDILDNGKELLNFAMCGNCANQWGIAAGAILPASVANEDGLPWMAPVCGPCFATLCAAADN